ncbi:MAG TPA: hypothetical protein VF432_32885 [Thermoanaerobaculia bacterium]
MDVNSASFHFATTPTGKVVVLFCMAWPFLALAFIRRGERSSAPLVAMLIPIAVGLSGAWLSLVDVLGALPVTGGGRAARAAGVAEALLLILIGAGCAGCVGVVALMRRHRPVLDRGAALLAALLVAGIGTALAVRPTIPLSLACAAATGVLAIAMFVWLFLVMRKRVAPRAVPLGTAGLAVAMAATIAATWQQMQAHIRIAIGG